MKKHIICALLIAIAGLPGCCFRRCKPVAKAPETEKTVKIPFNTKKTYNTDKDISQVDGFFDEEAGEIVDIKETVISESTVKGDALRDTTAWLEQSSVTTAQLKPIYFDFDKTEIRADQKAQVAANAKEVHSIVTEETKKGNNPKVVVEGHADKLTKCDAYNFGVSEERAVKVAGALETEGIPAQSIKVVGRGSDVPALVDGKPVTGKTKEALAPNRRVELHIVNA